MKTSDRWLLAVGMVLVDTFVFMVPLTGLTAAYVLIAKPGWFKRFVDELYSS